MIKSEKYEVYKAETPIVMNGAPPLVCSGESWDKVFQGAFVYVIIEEMRKEGDTIRWHLRIYTSIRNTVC